MCQSISAGGQRCAAHTRPRYQSAPFGTPEWDTAAAAYASTPTGRMELASSLAAAEAATDVRSAVAFEHALAEGARMREKASLFREALAGATVPAPLPSAPSAPVSEPFPADTAAFAPNYPDDDPASGEADDDFGWHSPTMMGQTWNFSDPVFARCTSAMTQDAFVDQVCENTGITRAEFETAAAGYLAEHAVPIHVDGTSLIGYGASDELSGTAGLSAFYDSGAALGFTPEQIRLIALRAKEQRTLREQREAAQAAEAAAAALAAARTTPEGGTGDITTAPGVAALHWNGHTIPLSRYGNADISAVPDDRLPDLAASTDATLRAAVARDERTPADLVTSLATSDSTLAVRAAAARNPNLVPSAMAGLVTDRAAQVRAGIARNPSLPIEHVAVLAADRSATVQGAASGMSARRAACLRTVALPEPARVAYTSTGVAGLRAIVRDLSFDADRTVRSTLAKNRTLAVQPLRRLVRDSEQSVRSNAVRNPNFPASLLRGAVARDSAAGVRASVARNPRTPVGTLARLAADEDPWVRRNLAWNPTTPALILAQLRNDPDEGVRESAVTREERPDRVSA